MKKETLLLPNVTNDLKTVAKFQIKNIGDWRFSYIGSLTLISVVIGVLLQSVWIALLIFSAAAYHIVRYILEYRRYRIEIKAVMSAVDRAVDRADISISTERLSHVATETIYEPHSAGKSTQLTKNVTYFYFESGSRWRVPRVPEHYKWSRNFHTSRTGLENVSLQGDEFYIISLQGYHDIAYIYPCKYFDLDVNWGISH